MKEDSNAEMKRFIAEQFSDFSKQLEKQIDEKLDKRFAKFSVELDKKLDQKFNENNAIIRREMRDMERRLEMRITVEVNAMGVRLMAEIDEVSKNMAKLEIRLTRRLETKINELSASVAEALETNHEHYDTWLKDHELRLNRLETHSA